MNSITVHYEEGQGLEGYRYTSVKTDTSYYQYNNGDVVQDYNNAFSFCKRNGGIILASSSCDSILMESDEIDIDEDGFFYYVDQKENSEYSFDIHSWIGDEIIQVRKGNSVVFEFPKDELEDLKSLLNQIDDKLTERWYNS